ncbi:MAG TPA: poly-beta-1,6 N-acetyl-D-glucosamine export porin PgaA [Candidatus Competibacteraceae bacterium]|nr:poly-beta-1,6 N-acetyl-D-glucosamine export porin PgaA [Candidatus Competibacteraceae bacterium]
MLLKISYTSRLVGLCLGILALATAAATTDGEYATAIEQARAGRYTQALPVLRRLHATQPDNTAYLYDLIAVLTWAGQNDEALRYFRTVDAGQAPDYVLRPVAKAAREVRQFETAVHLYRLLVGRRADDWDARLGLALSYRDLGRRDEAYRALAEAARAAGREADRMTLALLRGEWLRRDGQPLQAIHAYREVLGLEPQQPVARRALVELARQLHAPAVARDYAGEGLLTPVEEADLRLDYGAAQIRQALGAPLEAQRHAAQQALALNDQAQQAVRALADPAEQRERRLRADYDRILALSAARRWHELVALYQDLVQRGPEPRPYVQAVAADAYLALRRPEQAVALYRRALELDQGTLHVDWESGLFYALLESERYPEAWAQIDALAQRVPPFLRTYSPQTREPNPDYLGVLATRAMAQAYGERLAAADASLQRLRELAPFNGDIRANQASVWYFRGQPERARNEFQRVLVDEPHHRGARAGYAGTLLELGEYEQAVAEVETLLLQDPGYAPALRLQEQLESLEQWELRTAAVSDGNQLRQAGAGRGFWFNYRIATPALVDHRLRLHAGQAHQGGSVDGRDANRDRYSVGLDYRGVGKHWSGEILWDELQPDHPGLALRYQQRLGDAWDWSLSWQSVAEDLPLKAVVNDVRANELALRASYHPDESLRLGGRFSGMDFSDGNRRLSLGLDLERQLYRDHRDRYLLLGSAYASTNDFDQAVYFNPHRDAELALGARWERLLARRYERRWLQRVTVLAGGYWQEDFGTKPSLRLGYEQEWDWDRNLGLQGGVSYRVHPYDGETEAGLELSVRLNWRF